MKYHIIFSLLAGFILDCLIGDPEKLPHPVRGIGRLISALETKLRRETDSSEKQRGKGTILVILVVFLTVFLTGVLLKAAYFVHPFLGLLLESILCAQALAARNLRDASMKVYYALKAGDLEQARTAVSMIVGRDTAVLDQTGITKAAVETVAENTSDGVTAPLFYLALGGPVAGMAYKAINTMDSMLGYRNQKYQYFGTAAARLDDVVNLLPSRISGILMVPAAALCGLDAAGAWRIFRRDRKKHASPNSAQTESACAGALQVKLAGDAVYFGKVVHKHEIGDDVKKIETEDIRRANRLMYTTTVVSLLLFLGLRYIVIRFLGF